MEQISEQFKKEHAAAERADGPKSWCIRAVNLMNALNVAGPLTGEQVRDLVDQAEKRGLNIPIIPLKKLDAAEVRSFTQAVAAQRAHIVIPDTRPAKKTTNTAINENDRLKLKVREQQQRFEMMLMEEGITREELEAKIAEDRDPLMRVANVRNPRRN